MVRASYLSVGRRYAEAGMAWECVITRKTGTVFNETTGLNVPTVVPVWAGPCDLQLPTPRVFARASQDQLLTEQQPILKVPVEGTADVTVGDDVVITASPTDPASVGLQLKVAGVHPATYSTARRLPVYAITEALNG